jgi:hypothetical protein
MTARSNHSRQAWLILLAVAALAMSQGCSKQRAASSEEKRINAVSETEPKFEPLPRAAPVLALQTPVASSGDCAPKYAIGLRGSCINNKPCRGFGVVGEGGAPVCACFAKAGGCGETERCDVIKKVCVSESEPGLGRLPDD